MQIAQEHIKMEDYTYDLPQDKIAKFPLEDRDSSKLLCYENGNIDEQTFPMISNWVPAHSLMIKNNTRVIQARLLFNKSSGARIEIFCLEPVFPSDYESNLSARKKVIWKCLIGNSKKWKSGSLKKEIYIDGKSILLEAKKVSSSMSEHNIEFSWEPANYSFSELLARTGLMPIPPYLNRKAEEGDRKWYQTIYAQHLGSVAAPTAGLHFTDTILDSLAKQKTHLAELTLHVGAGTFTPVKDKKIQNHKMHAEHVQVSKELIQSVLNHTEKGITAVGTTTLRSLESMYWLGVLCYEKKVNFSQTIEIDQWLPYQDKSGIETTTSLRSLLTAMTNAGVNEISFITRIIIVPGYAFKIVDQLITNFHQPNSTLLLLVAAFIGEDWKRVYNFALNNKFRFLSYGDSSVLRRRNEPFSQLM
ncbi:MAG: S-adenosylmethionine:tRNA ribosyltransferase-isomerase [Bacteroidetes bacterium]|nr:S-adenosylmethionine:tRNA ribosyltransferase-isomerase [Bacteroidota bacterium]